MIFKKKVSKSKKMVMIALFIVIVSGGFAWQLYQKPPEDGLLRQREYPVKKDNITVGIETSGVISAAPNAHSLAEHTVIEEILVKVGLDVSKGDSIAKISIEKLQILINETKDKLANAKVALLQATGAKEVMLEQNATRKARDTSGIHYDYLSKLEKLQVEKNRLESDIKSFEDARVILRETVSQSALKNLESEMAIDKLKEQIQANTKLIGELNEKLLKVDDGSRSRAYFNQTISGAKGQIQTINGQLLTQKDPKQIELLNQKIQELQTEIQNAQDQLPYILDGSIESNSLRLEITKLQNTNTALQQNVDQLVAKGHFKSIEKDRISLSDCEASLKQSNLNLITKVEEMERLGKDYEFALQLQGVNDQSADYKVGKELAAINVSITAAQRNVGYFTAQINQLQALKKNPIIEAQIGGVVTAINYQVGETISAGKPLCTIGELEKPFMTVPIPAADINRVALGQKAKIFIDAYAEKEFYGYITEILWVANDNGDYLVTIALESGPESEGASRKLLPGMKAFATIVVKEKRDLLTISNKAILLENGEQYVNLKTKEGILVKTKVITGFSDGRISEVVQGLMENDIAVVEE